MSAIKAFLNHPYTFWALLSLPAIPMVAGLAGGDPDAVHDLLHPSGEFSARFMILAMMITPLAMLLRGWRGPRWLMKRRRHIGVAAFSYAALHTLLYLMDRGALALTAGEARQLYIWTGWFAFGIFVPLAVTSTDEWVRTLGRRWKILQRFVYAAAVLTLVHWAALKDWGGVVPALANFLPLILLEAWRVTSTLQRRQLRAAQG